MDWVPSSVMTAVAASAAAGKNPWLPLGLILLLAGIDGVPDWLMEPHLHAGLHDLANPNLMLGAGIFFLVLSLADSFADKISWLESWLTPISTTWRPFAAVAVAALVGAGAAAASNVDISGAAPAATAAMGLAETAAPESDSLGWLGSAGLFVLVLGLGLVFGLLATVGKVGTRLLLGLIPLPGLKLLHSVLDDVFALAVTLAGLMFADSILLPILGALYLGSGLLTAPVLFRLTFIHLRIGMLGAGKAWRSLRDVPEPETKIPGWLSKRLTAAGVEPGEAQVLPAYAYRTRETGWCRGGFLVLGSDGLRFVARTLFGQKELRVDNADLMRLGLSESSTARSLSLVQKLSSGAVFETTIHLFPTSGDRAEGALTSGLQQVGLIRVLAASESARSGLADDARSVPGSKSGSLHLQGLLTVAAAIGLGILSAGTFIPIGFGYVASPFKGRFLLGLLMSGYLSLLVVGTLGLGWPVAVLYGTLLNIVALRDLARQALEAHVNGHLSGRFLPIVCGKVWTAANLAQNPADHWRGEDDPMTDGSWRAVLEVITRTAPSAPEPPAATAAS